MRSFLKQVRTALPSKIKATNAFVKAKMKDNSVSPYVSTKYPRLEPFPSFPLSVELATFTEISVYDQPFDKKNLSSCRLFYTLPFQRSTGISLLSDAAKPSSYCICGNPLTLVTRGMHTKYNSRKFSPNHPFHINTSSDMASVILASKTRACRESY